MHVNPAVFIESVPDAVIVFRPAKSEGVLGGISGLPLRRQHNLGFRKPPRAALSRKLLAAGGGMNVGGKGRASLLVEILQWRSFFRRHYQIGAFCVGSHPENERPI